MPDDLWTKIPMWGLFALLMTKLTLDWAAKWAQRKESVAGEGKPSAPSPQEIAAVMRDQDERKEILDGLRTQSQNLERILEVMGSNAESLDRIAETQESIAELLHKMHNGLDSIDRKVVELMKHGNLNGRG